MNRRARDVVRRGKLVEGFVTTESYARRRYGLVFAHESPERAA